MRLKYSQGNALTYLLILVIWVPKSKAPRHSLACFRPQSTRAAAF